MSTFLAIAAVTGALRTMLDAEIKEIDNASKVTIQPPDQSAAANNALNLFLYHIGVNGALRNNPALTTGARHGETREPPLALDLYYLLSAYGKGAADTRDDQAHRLLGCAMSTLNDHAVLLRDELRAALAEAKLDQQVERVRVTLQPLTLEEMSKLWATFQTNYRLSVCYQVSVVLIESQKPAVAPLPVLSIGEGNAGVQVQPDLAPLLPTLTGIDLPAWTTEPVLGLLPGRRPSARLGDKITLRGLNLGGQNVKVLFRHPRLDDVIELAANAGASALSLDAVIPNQPAEWPAGIYTVSVAVTQGKRRRETNRLPLALAPAISGRAPATTADADFTLTVTCSPEVRKEQDVAVLFGGRELMPDAVGGNTTTLTFAVKGATPGLYPLRLRVDGAESVMIKVASSPPVAGFDPDQIVEVTP